MLQMISVDEKKSHEHVDNMNNTQRLETQEAIGTNQIYLPQVMGTSGNANLNMSADDIKPMTEADENNDNQDPYKPKM